MASGCLRTRSTVSFILFLLSGTCFSASLNCHDAENKDKNCFLKIPYADIADSFNLLNCEPGEDGLECQFELLDGEDSISSSTSSKAATIDECSRNENYDEVVCIQAEVQTLVHRNQQSTREHNFPQQQQQQQHHESAAKGDKSAVEKIYNSNSKNNDGGLEALDFSIKVGKYRYREPFHRYAAPLATALETHADLWKTSPRGGRHEYAMANALYAIGIAHFTAVVHEDTNPDVYTDSLVESFDLQMSVNAFKEAEKMYSHVLDTHSKDNRLVYRRQLFASMGGLYLQWGEVYQSNHYYQDEASLDYEGLSSNDLAMRSFGKSEMHYRLSLDTAMDSMTVADVIETKTHLAHACYRVGRCRINSLSGASARTIMYGVSGEVLPNALPQLQILLSITANAEEKFEEAASLYRMVIGAEKNFHSQVALKNHLITVLQDYGTALTYASNIPKAIELQKEAIVLCREVLPHLQGLLGGNQQFMIQFLATSQVSVANLLTDLGKYDEANEMYDSAMEWYEQHNLKPTETQFLSYADSDASLEAIEKQLDDFHELKVEYSIPDGSAQFSGEAAYAVNEAYEGYLHATLGTLHLSRNEIFMAIEQLNQAVRLYEEDEAGQDLDQSIAVTKTSLAAAYLQNADYALSGTTHREAMEIFRATMDTDEGGNPEITNLLSQLANAGVDLGELVQNNEFTDFHTAEDVQNRLARLSSKELSALLGEIIQAKEVAKDQQSLPQSTSTVKEVDRDRTNQARDLAEAKKAHEKVHKQLIDIEQIRQNSLNETSSLQDEL